MPYCPRCGREQRCGCPNCHICGVELTEQPVPPAAAQRRSGPKQARLREADGERAERGDVTHQTGGPSPPRPGAGETALPALFLVFGCGILLVTLIEAVNNAFGFPGLGGAATAADAVKRVGYYLGNLLYISSVRGMIGFALLGAGLLLENGRLFADRAFSRVARRVTGFAMGAVAALCFVASLLLLLPVGTGTLVLTNLLPPLGAAVPILLVMGAAFSGGAWMMLSSAGVRPARKA